MEIFEEFYPDLESKKRKAVILKSLKQEEFSDVELILTEKASDIFKYLMFSVALLLFSIFPFIVEDCCLKILQEIQLAWYKLGALFFGVLIGLNSILKLINVEKRQRLTISKSGIEYMNRFSEDIEYIHRDSIKVGVIKLFGIIDNIRAFLLILKTDHELISIEITNLKSKEQTIFTDKEWIVWRSGRFPDHIKIRNLLGEIETSQ